MGRFAWTPSHRSQPSDGKHVLPEWFSKSSGEPSRQAIAELVKDHQSNSPPGTILTRSRTNTLSSAPSRGHRSSSSPSSGGRQSRPASRHGHEQNDGNHGKPSSGEHEKSPQTLLSKGSRMMRRQTSKLNVLSSQLNEALSSSESQARMHAIPRVKSAGHLLGLHSKRDLSRPQISGPFDFQHVTHTDQSQYQHICKSTKTNLVDSFNALQADQHPQQDIQGIPVNDLHAAAAGDVSTLLSRPQSPALSVGPSLPSETIKPSPPPKDPLTLRTVDVEMKMSRLVDNFSRPTRTSPLLDNQHEHHQQGDLDEDLAAAPSVSLSTPRVLADNVHYTSVPPSPQPRPDLAPSPMLDKPLPQPPPIVHAVSTSDLSTLHLKTSPLPEVPQQQAKRSGQSPIAPPRDAEASSPKASRSGSRSSIRHMQSFPVGRVPRRRTQSSHKLPSASTLAFATEMPSSPPRPAQTCDRVSVGLKVINVDDWEDAIDYSWDHALDYDEDQDRVERCDSRTMAKSDVLPQSSFGVCRTSNNTPQPGSFPAQGIRQHKSELSLHGLGINPAHRCSGTCGPGFGVVANKRESLRMPYSRRTSGSPLSKSSSQESIILSIASSIMSTHRSSNSSTSLGDINQLCSIEDECSPSVAYSQSKGSNGGSVSSSDTVTKDMMPVPALHSTTQEDAFVELPILGHHRGASTPLFPSIPNRRSSMTPAGKAAVRQRSSTLTQRGTKLYSLFPTTQPIPPAV